MRANRSKVSDIRPVGVPSLFVLIHGNHRSLLTVTLSSSGGRLIDLRLGTAEPARGRGGLRPEPARR